MTQDNEAPPKRTWGNKEQEIIDAVKAHRDWFTENYDLVKEQAGEKFEKIESYINGAEETIAKYQEIGEDREGNVSGHMKYNVFVWRNTGYKRFEILDALNKKTDDNDTESAKSGGSSNDNKD